MFGHHALLTNHAYLVDSWRHVVPGSCQDKMSEARIPEESFSFWAADRPTDRRWMRRTPSLDVLLSKNRSKGDPIFTFSQRDNWSLPPPPRRPRGPKQDWMLRSVGGDNFLLSGAFSSDCSVLFSDVLSSGEDENPCSIQD